MSITVSGAALVLFGVYGLHTVETKQADLRAGIVREMRLLGRALQVASENALRDLQTVDIQETVDKLETICSNIDILFLDLSGEVITSSHGVQKSDPIYSQAVHDPTETILQFDPPDNPVRAILATPLLSDEGLLMGQMIVVRPLDDMLLSIRMTKLSTAMSMGLFVLVTTLLSALLGSVYVGRPLKSMMEAMRKIRDGNLETTLPVQRMDEVGQLTEEFNIMQLKLNRARVRLEQEEAVKRQMEQALRQSDKLATVGQLSAGLAHEIGSPLQILNGRARYLLSSALREEEMRRNAEIIVSQTDRIARIVNQLLQITRRGAPRIEEMDLAVTVSSVVDLLQIESRRKQIGLFIKCDPNTPRLFADPNSIQQVALNLITNALQATKPGGSVIISIASSTIQNVGGAQLPGVRMAVKDTGCGIPAEQLDKIFGFFFTTRSSDGGWGLGLAIVKAIVEEHHGTICVESKLGEGSNFIIDLPASISPLKCATPDLRANQEFSGQIAVA